MIVCDFAFKSFHRFASRGRFDGSKYTAVRWESHCKCPIRITGDVSHPFVLRYGVFPISCFRVRRVNSPVRHRHRRRRMMAYNRSHSDYPDSVSARTSGRNLPINSSTMGIVALNERGHRSRVYYGCRVIILTWSPLCARGDISFPVAAQTVWTFRGDLY